MLKFFKQNNRWYADVPGHTLEENEMVAGADQLLNELCTKCGFNDSISLDIDIAPKQPLITLKMIEHDSCGATYSVKSHMKFELDTKIVWICNVTHDVLGEHPEIIYINQMKGNLLNTTMERPKTKKRNALVCTVTCTPISGSGKKTIKESFSGSSKKIKLDKNTTYSVKITYKSVICAYHYGTKKEGYAYISALHKAKLA